jgi:hypothetical protein
MLIPHRSPLSRNLVGKAGYRQPLACIAIARRGDPSAGSTRRVVLLPSVTPNGHASTEG